ncbi:hypothetical protein, partial [Leucobacter sp. M11]
HFAIDREAVVVKVLQRLAASGQIPADVPAEAIKHYRLLDVNAGST